MVKKVQSEDECVLASLLHAIVQEVSDTLSEVTTTVARKIHILAPPSLMRLTMVMMIMNHLLMMKAKLLPPILQKPRVKAPLQSKKNQHSSLLMTVSFLLHPIKLKHCD